ncbi:hypothetical protein QQS21_004564 [Conoideocrella luteorostrata]|uniref:Aquaporin-like protein n=1 Tax=Conoideocrella luteorostrata TaxID=1105319 RepID=A0AAJ0G1H8_9HYPO|nr:hypothetical protein QQS21_004564 [Conoideocrella luteorostrata]
MNHVWEPALIQFLRAQSASEDVHPTAPESMASPSRSSRTRQRQRGLTLPSRMAHGVDGMFDNEEIRRHNSNYSWRPSDRVPSLAPRTTLAERTQGQFTVAGPEETSNLRQSQEPFVQPGYAELNPSYDQPQSAKPVWSLAKPLPRVVRPGMVPTKAELFESRQKAQLPAENSQKQGLDVDPNELEQGRVGLNADPRKIAAQVEDARRQREGNLMSKILAGEGLARRQSRVSRASSSRERRPSNLDLPEDHLSTVPEREPDLGTREPRPLRHPSDDHVHPASEEQLTGPWHEDEQTPPEVDVPEILKSELPEDLHPLVQDLVEKEVHNNHTAWSVIRTHHREALAESLAVFVQLTIGFSADLAVTLGVAPSPNTTAWSWGFATMMAIYISGGVSGAHLNPAITILLWFYRGFPKRKMPEYFAAQFVGAFVAGLVAYGVYSASINEYLVTSADTGIVTSFVTSQRQNWVNPAAAFFNEFLGSVFLSITILALGDDQNAPPGAGMNSLIIGLVITCLSMTFSYQTGAAFNPSRDFGPRLALLALGYPGNLFSNPYWFYGPWAGAVSGAMIGGLMYDSMVFTGGESPVNYPLERTKRAMKKGGQKWKRRYQRARKGQLFSRRRKDLGN